MVPINVQKSIVATNIIIGGCIESVVLIVCQERLAQFSIKWLRTIMGHTTAGYFQETELGIGHGRGHEWIE